MTFVATRKRDDTSITSMRSHTEETGRRSMRGQVGHSELDESESENGKKEEIPIVSPNHQAAQQARQELGLRETRVIWFLRLVFVFVFLLLAVAAGITTYVWVKHNEQSAFETEFAFYAEKVIRMFNAGFERKLGAIDALSTGITSYAMQSSSSFPNVTIPDFVYRGSSARISGDIPMIFYLPIVTTENKEQWEAYSWKEHSQTTSSWNMEQEAKATQDEKFGVTSVDSPFSGNQTVEKPKEPKSIWFAEYPFESAGIYFPLWQISPAMPPVVDVVNFDFASFYFLTGSLETTRRTGDAVIDSIVNLAEADSSTNSNINSTNDGMSLAVFDLLMSLGQYRGSSEHYMRDPLSAMSYPVFDRLGANRTVVGILFSTLYWRMLMIYILPYDITGIVCVLENTAGEVVTYQIDGIQARYIGTGDLHDPSFDDMVWSINIADYMKQYSSPATRSFTAVDLNSDFLTYSLRVYPSTEFQHIYITNTPLHQGLMTASVFVLCMTLFLVYDCFVRRRQLIVLDRAVKATVVISSLFPDIVSEQIINDDSNDVQAMSKNQAFRAGKSEESKNETANPIAHNYPNCTVLFADLVGFTEWSSTRAPEEVFRLLEACWKELDAIALRRSVYKVETIGDCYMAVAGCPHPQPDHAVRMAKFAFECQHRMAQLTVELSVELGNGTDDLAMRIGLHSGDVIGGVLKGDKRRFQLFGDTVNTASRMESTGCPRKIHLSQATADELIVQGKSNWLVPRAEKVVAKGKGELQTYFLYLEGASSELASSQSIPSSAKAA